MKNLFKKKPIKYFIAFRHVAEGVVVCGNVDVLRSEAIKTISDVREIQEIIGQANNMQQVVITNWQRF